MAEKDYVKTVYVDGSEPDVDAVHLNNTEDGLDGLYHPEFDDSGTVEGITSFPIFLSTVVKRMNPIAFYKNFKAGMKYVLHTGSLINNGLCTETGKYAADATQLNPNIANTLAWQVAKVNSDLGDKYGPARLLTSADDLNSITGNGTYWYWTDSVPANAPYDNASIVEVIGSKSSATQKLQRVTRFGVAGQSAWRVLDSAGWKDWAYNLTSNNMIYSNSLTDLVSQMSKLQVLRAYTLFADSQLGAELTGTTASCTGVISKLGNTMYDVLISQSAGIYIYTIRIQNGAVSSRRRITLTQVE